MSAQRSLPPRPSLEQQKKLAKDLLDAFRADDPDAIARIRAQLPDKKRITLADAQLTLAREYRFESWAALKAHLESLAHSVPKSVRQKLHEAFEVRDWDGVRRHFRDYPALRGMIDDPMFPFDTPVLVQYASRQDLEAVDLLLELGADPNRRTGWWAGGFHPLHYARGAVAERLIAGGSVPDACGAAQMDRLDLLETILREDPGRVHERGGDGQTPLHFARSREVVDLLLAHGADIDARDVDHRSSPAHWMLQGKKGAGRYALAEYLVEKGAQVDVFLAAALGLTDRLRTMLERDPALMDARTGRGDYGPKPPSAFHIYTWTIGQYLSPLQVAEQFDQPATVELLRSFATPADRLLTALAAPRPDEARAILREHPRLLKDLTGDELRVLPDAAWAGNTAAVELMLSLGIDASAKSQDSGTLLHCAAWKGFADCIEVALRYDQVRALIEVRDDTHESTPLGWCCHGARFAHTAGDYPRVAELLLEAGAKPGPNLDDAPEAVLEVIRRHTLTKNPSRATRA